MGKLFHESKESLLELDHVSLRKIVMSNMFKVAPVSPKPFVMAQTIPTAVAAPSPDIAEPFPDFAAPAPSMPEIVTKPPPKKIVTKKTPEPPTSFKAPAFSFTGASAPAKKKAKKTT